MTNKKANFAGEQSRKRRNALKTILAGGGVISVGSNLPDNWKRPVLDAVSLPAHAQTSPKENGQVATTGP
jgi:hypothetical protein